MNAGGIRFTSSDAWLLLSIAWASRDRGASLKDIIAAGDAINHAIFGPQELRRGFAKLIAAGYVARKRGRYFVRGAAAEFYRSTIVRSRSTYDTLDELKDFLGVTPGSSDDGPGHEDPRWPFPKLSDGAVKEAWAEYHEECQATLQRLRDKDAGR